MHMGWLMMLILVIAATMPPIAVGQAQEAKEEVGHEQSETCPHEKEWKAEDLPGILKKHREWAARWSDTSYSRQWAEDHPEGRANLCTADLTRTTLTKADLVGATLANARLDWANLTEAV